MPREEPISPCEWDGHLALLHSTESERRSRLVTWVRRGLTRDELVIYAQVEPPQRSALTVLAACGIDVEAATAEGRLLMLPLPQFYQHGQEEVVRRALAEGHAAVRLTAEASAAPEGAHADIERTIEQLCRHYPVSALCQYDKTTTTGSRLGEVAAHHIGGIWERQLQTSEAEGRLILSGAVDVDNDQILAAVLSAATSPASGVLPIDFSRVEFLSVSACRALAESTEKFRARGGQLLLIAPQPAVERIIRLIGLDRLMLIKTVEERP